MSDFFQVSNPKDFFARPLTKGMVSNTSPVEAPEGSFNAINGFNVSGKGPTRWGGWHPVIRESTGFSTIVPWELPLEDERAEDFVQLQLRDGTSRVYLVSSRFLYETNIDTGYTPVFFQDEQEIGTYTAGTNPVIVVEDVDLVALDVLTTDYIWMTKGGVTEKVAIESITSDGTDTTITLDAAFAGITPVATDVFRILKPFRAGSEWFVDFTCLNNALYLVDTDSPFVFKLDSENYLTAMHVVSSSGARTMYGARSICSFGNRLFFGDVTEPDGAGSQFFLHQRIRWTSIASPAVSEPAYYQDLVQSQTSVVKLSSLGSMLMAYTYDVPYWGRPTNLSDLPYAFAAIETGGISIVGMKAVTSFISGQIFVGSDNVYVISVEGGVSRIGDAVARQSVFMLREPWRTIALSDPDNSRILFGYSFAGGSIDTLFTYNTETSAWSFYADDQLRYQTIAAFQLQNELTYEDAEAETWTYETSPYSNSPYYELATMQVSKQIFAVLDNSHLVQHNKTADRHYLPNAAADIELPILGYLETPDLDFDAGNTDKTVLRLSLGLEEDLQLDPRVNRIVFLVEWSYDRGRSWRSLGYLTYRVGDEEDALDFRATAPILRFRLTLANSALATDSVVQPFSISELGLRVRARGPQAHANMARPA
jgi:hypothetical protein